MCGGPVRKATGGVIKSAAPKSVAKSAAAGKQLPTPEIAPKRQVQPTPPKDVVREAPRPTMEPKRQVQPTPPKDVRTIGGAPKSAKTMIGEPRRSDEGISAKQRLAGTAGDYAAPPEKAKTMGGAPKDAKTMGSISPGAKTFGNAVQKAQAMGAASRDAKTMGSISPGAKTMGSVSPGAKTMGSVSPGAKTIGGTPKGGMTMGKSAVDGLTKSIKGTPLTGPLGSVAKNPTKGSAALSKMAQSAAKGVSSVNTAKRGVPVASNKPMIGFKTGGHVTKSSFKW